MTFLKEHFAEVTLIWLSLVFVGLVIMLGYFPIQDKDTISWIRGVGNGFTYALLLALKLRTGVSNSDTQTTNTNVTTTKIDTGEGK